MDLYYRRFCKSVRSGPRDFSCYWDRACVLRGMARSYKGPYRNNKKRVEENSQNQSDGCIFVYFRIVWGRYVHFCFPSDGVFGDRRVGYANTVHKNPGSCALECITGGNIWIRLSPAGSAWIYQHCFAVLSAYKIQLCFSSDQPGHYFCANGSFTVSSPVGAEIAGSHSFCRELSRYFPDKYISLVWSKDLVAISADYGADNFRDDLPAFCSLFLGKKGKELIIGQT